ncbi:MAG TPA: erythromycin esterase family protein [Longimicrobium sp.]|jgi:erythromycin esterase-like protein|uniref:erythromycin esterase family protein n=1 Tax=Longimicrobium sp. TaxID=2029185 RepID=UPI002ED8A07F
MKTPFRTRLAAVLCALLFAGACEGDGTGATGGLNGEEARLAESVRQAAIPLTGAADEYDPLLAMLNGRRFALLGEATHGTHEFYRERAEISQRLIAEQQFAAVIVEGEWEDAWSANQYVRGTGGETSAAAALGAFNQFPLWMWRNPEVAGFLDWLRTHNAARPAAQRVGFYGMDVYGLMESLREVPRLLEAVDPAAAEQARTRYACFGEYRSAEAYGRAVAAGASAGCADEARTQLAELHARWSASPGDEQLFNAMQNARVVAGGEQYFRISYRGGNAWNQRDQHMAETVTDLSRHLEARGMSGRVIAWAHNSHVGDARAAFLGGGMEQTLGRLMRERHGEQVGLVGFTTFDGSVRAAAAWGAPGQERDVRPALAGSWESVFHGTGIPSFLLLLNQAPLAAEIGDRRLLQRAIGVSYHPETERQSHYFTAEIGSQFDAVIHIDQTTALGTLAE